MDGAAALGFFIALGGSYKVRSELLKLYLEIRLRLLFFFFKFDVGFGIECDFFLSHLGFNFGL